ncbi:hypothetical protein R3Q06_29930 [Rhodococcus erythropolis]|uniref:hypothetical protein n=1 Tax=Rhodococcus erythropolis TaxID=1833 RepID=UPI0029498B36|nr:hypothetical protein [Rhodococcus erythropolis]MDV6277717.1 hypothetical protein [Rhodococcus erythropolis]
MNITKNKNLLRKAAYAPLAAAVLAGAVCAGTGIGSAATDTGADAGVSVPDRTWRVVNDTGKELTGGKFGKMDENHPIGTIYVTGLKPNEARYGSYESGGILDSNGTMADGVCYNNRMWHMKPEVTSGSKWASVHVRVDQASGDLFIAPEGGGDFRMMFTLNGGC